MQTTTLFQTLCTPTFLFEAWKHVKSKNAAGGIDGLSIAAFEDKLETYIREISDSLKLGKWVSLICGLKSRRKITKRESWVFFP